MPSFPPLLWSPNLDQSILIFQVWFSLSWGFPPATEPYYHFPSLGAQREGRGRPHPVDVKLLSPEIHPSPPSWQRQGLATACCTGAPPPLTVSQLETQIYLQGEVRKIVNRLATEQLRLQCVLILLIT